MEVRHTMIEIGDNLDRRKL